MHFELLNNSAISALVGAFSAFLLVMFTDYIRSKRVKSDIKKLLKSDQYLVRDKKDAITNYEKALQENSVQGDRLTPFSFDEIRQMKLNSIERFKQKELAVLQTICFHMESIDKMIDNTAKEAEIIRQNPKDNHEYRLSYIMGLYKDILPNLDRLNEIIGSYLDKNMDQILKKKYHQKHYSDR